ncbi:metallophosphoesterase family protein [Peribacillus sp. SCS-155]|uniref:metallophosphoesterase family protein n=1 Tax=Peribacillus sedimenti TaxID=3115297 RepID=UPI0039069820
MKVLIVSDSHGLTEELLNVKARHKDCDYLIHCGDSELRMDDPAMDGFLAVQGNCDMEPYPTELIRDIGEITLYVTHGHLYNVKMTLMNLSYKSEETGANIICFGHSHLAGSEMVDGRLFINPGSMRLPRRISSKTYILLELDGREAKVDFYDVEGNFIEHLSSTYTLA